MTETDQPNQNLQIISAHEADVIQMLSGSDTSARNRGLIADELIESLDYQGGQELVRRIALRVASNKANQHVMDSIQNLTGLTLITSQYAQLTREMPDFNSMPRTDGSELLNLLASPTKMARTNKGIGKMFSLINPTSFESSNETGAATSFTDTMFASLERSKYIMNNIRYGQSPYSGLPVLTDEGFRTKLRAETPDEFLCERAVRQLMNIPALRFAMDLHAHHVDLAYEVVAAAKIMESQMQTQFDIEQSLHAEVESLAQELQNAFDQEKGALSAMSTLSTDILALQFPHLQNELRPDEALQLFIELHSKLAVNDEQSHTLSLNRTLSYYATLRANTAARMQSIIYGMRNRLQQNQSSQAAFMDWMGVLPLYTTAVGESATILQVAPTAISTELSRLQLELLYKDRARIVIEKLVENRDLLEIPDAIHPDRVTERLNSVIHSSIIRK